MCDAKDDVALSLSIAHLLKNKQLFMSHKEH